VPPILSAGAAGSNSRARVTRSGKLPEFMAEQGEESSGRLGWLVVILVVVLAAGGSQDGRAAPGGLTRNEVAEAARTAGFSFWTVPKAVRIAECESGLRPAAEGDRDRQNRTWGPSVGLWQIRSRRGAWGTGSVRDANRLKDPAFNARAAFVLSEGGRDWSKWTCGP
jgi:hypothetical protein